MRGSSHMRNRARQAAISGIALVAFACLAGCSDTTKPKTTCDTPGTMCIEVGTGDSAFNGDGRQALATALYWPQRMAFDAQGRLYFTDQNNHRVRRVEANGVVTTFAGSGGLGGATGGGLATTTTLYHPSALAFDTAGNLDAASDHRRPDVGITPRHTA